MLWSIDRCQLKQVIHWPVSHDRIIGSGANSSRSHVFLKFSTDHLLAFNWSWAQVYVFQSYGFPLKLSIIICGLFNNFKSIVCGKFKMHRQEFGFKLWLKLFINTKLYVISGFW